MVCSADQCLLDLDGSLKFVRFNSFLESLLPQEFATKNDGRQIFFDIRDLVYAKIHDDIKKGFQNIKSATFSLDKVTVRRTSFTVIMSYFFSKGKIFVFLNSVHKMKYDDYDGSGSAAMLGECL